MWFEIIRWSSIVIMWIAVGINICACVLNVRGYRKARALQKMYVEELKRLTNSEE